MIEVLVALVILGLGLLGTAGLQLATLRGTHFTTQASIATGLARDFEEITQMVRSTDTSTSEGNTALSSLDTSSSDTEGSTDCKGSSATCTPTVLQGFLLKEWKDRVRTELPGGRAVICRDSSPKDTSGTGQDMYHWSCDGLGDMLMIKIGWNAKADKGDKLLADTQANNRPRIAMTLFGNQKDFTD